VKSFFVNGHYRGGSSTSEVRLSRRSGDGSLPAGSREPYEGLWGKTFETGIWGEALAG